MSMLDGEWAKAAGVLVGSQILVQVDLFHCCSPLHFCFQRATLGSPFGGAGASAPERANPFAEEASPPSPSRLTPCHLSQRERQEQRSASFQQISPLHTIATALGSNFHSACSITRFCSTSGVSPGRISTAFCNRMGPPSHSSFTKWTVAPVTLQPRASAASWGRRPYMPGPQKEGISAGCTFRMRRG